MLKEINNFTVAIRKFFFTANLPSFILTTEQNVSRLKAKTLILFTVPLLFFVLASLFMVLKQNQVNQLKALDSSLQQAILLSELLHQLQRERGMSVIFLSSGGTKFSAQLTAQRRQTNSIVQRVANTSFVDSKGEIVPGIGDLAEQLSALRLDVSKFRIDAYAAMHSHNRQNSQLLQVISSMVNHSAEPELRVSFLAYVNFLKEKELLGIERAVLGGAFTRDKFLVGGYQYFVRLEAEQHMYREEFKAQASATLNVGLQTIQASADYRQVQIFRDIAHSNAATGGFFVDALIWFEVVSARIELLKDMGGHITEELLTKSQLSRLDADRKKWLWLGSLFIIICLTLVYGIKLIANINGSFFGQLIEYRALLENSSAGLVIIDVTDQRILFCNRRFVSMTGYTKSYLIGMKIADLYTEENRYKTVQLFAQLVSGAVNYIDQLTLLTKDGSSLFTELSSFPTKGHSGNYLAINTRDISEKIAAQHTLQTAQLALQTVINSMGCSVAVVDCKTAAVIYLNKSAELVYRDRGQLDSLWPQLVPDNCGWDRRARSQYHQEFTEQIYIASSKRWYQVTSKEIVWYDGSKVYFRMLEDISERYASDNRNRELLSEIRKLSLRNYSLQERERKQIAADLHDQLGQLMTGILLQAEYICRSVEKRDSAVTVPAKNIIDTTKTLMSSVRDITESLRPLLLDQLGLVEALRELVQQWQQLNTATAFSFEALDVNGRLPDLVEISIYRIVQESLTNASKHARAKNILVSLQLDCKNIEGGGVLKLKIADDGIGFNRDEAHFNGMGLINMRERVEALSGEFRLISNTGKGVDTLVSIPIAAPGAASET